MARQISVTLDLNTKTYIAGVSQAEAETAALDASLKELDRNVSETGRDMDKLAAETAVAKKELGDLGDKASRSSVNVKGLDDRIKEAQANVGRLSVTFAQSGDAIDRQNLNSAKRALALLEKTRRDILAFASSDTSERAAQLAAAGVAQEVSKGFAVAFEDLSSNAGEFLLPGVIALGASLAPLLGSVVSGAVVGAVGLGGIAGGIFAASHDAAVRQAATQFGADISQTFFGSGAAFVVPVQQSLAILSQDFKSLDLAGTFAKAAPYVTVLAQGIGDLAKNSMPGFNAVLDEAGPITNILARGLADTGTAFSSFLKDVVDSPGTLEGLQAAFHGLDSTISGVGVALRTLGDTYDIIKNLNVSLGPLSGNLTDALIPGLKQFEDLLGKAPGFIHEVDNGINSFGSHAVLIHQVERESTAASIAQSALASSVGYATQQANLQHAALEDLGKTYDELTKDLHNLDDANNNLAQSELDIKTALEQGKRGWDLNTQAGIDNRRMVDSAIDAAQKKRDAEIASSDGTQASINKINQAYNSEILKLEALAQQLGATKAQADLLNGYVITITTQYRVGGQSYNVGGGSSDQLIPHKAGGGFVPYGQSFIFNEQGPELARAVPGGLMISSAASTAQAWNGGMSGSGGGYSHTVDVLINGDKVRTLLITSGTNRGVPTSTLAAAYP